MSKARNKWYLFFPSTTPDSILETSLSGDVRVVLSSVFIDKSEIV